MRSRAFQLSHGFEQLLELTCLDEHLPEESKSRGGRLLSDEGAQPDLFQGWLEMCHSEHGANCEASLPPDTLDKAARSFKLRLIDVEAVEVLVGSLIDHYCALSYVWGDIESFKATAASLAPDARHPGEFSLPLGHHSASSEEPGLTQDTAAKASGRIRRTIRDAVEMTKRLGLRYLWLDSLCIIQDDVGD
ncbi:hypothetical protein AYL99_01218 [Fonsecaea erecta]|uniref:Heterokaryon incompatibility domain-containing protein n=1 Tax=Fonsecaea erecta TaxID=1367422 RepID=A0A179A0W4_9EURO|nr:hypothetical protein AYL99_01218 [Fonsecaea erecta]OAP65246.1 hypothetical protein AYL99_01218 [Fonsecaea erecta]